MTKAEKIDLLKEMLLIERVESAVTGSRLSILPFAGDKVAAAPIPRRVFSAKTGLRKKIKAKRRVTAQRPISR